MSLDVGSGSVRLGRYSLLTFLLLGGALTCTVGASDPEPQTGAHLYLVVEVANYAQSAEYRYFVPDGPATVIASRQDPQGEGLKRIISGVAEQHRVGREAAAQLRWKTAPAARWASISPDKRFVLVGFEDPSSDAMKSAALLRASDQSRVAQFESEGVIRYLQWSPDSQFIAILESTARVKKTLWGLLSAISGHPIELETFYVTSISANGQRKSRTRIANGVENGVAKLRLDQ